MGGASEKEEPFPNEEEKYSCYISHFLLFLSPLKNLEEVGRDGLCCTLSARGNSRPHILLHPDPQSDFQISLSEQPNFEMASIRNSRLIIEARS
jgi:hypothetical protein